MNPQKSTDIHTDPWMSMDINSHPWISRSASPELVTEDEQMVEFQVPGYVLGPGCLVAGADVAVRKRNEYARIERFYGQARTTCLSPNGTTWKVRGF
jgi:hypothetical protein